LLGAQTSFDVAQALAIGQLRERQTEELIQTGEALYLVVATVALNATVELVQRKEIHQLRKHGPASVHGSSQQHLHPEPEYRRN
jgi:hypothetical protein